MPYRFKPDAEQRVIDAHKAHYDAQLDRLKNAPISCSGDELRVAMKHAEHVKDIADAITRYVLFLDTESPGNRPYKVARDDKYQTSEELFGYFDWVKYLDEEKV